MLLLKIVRKMIIFLKTWKLLFFNYVHVICFYKFLFCIFRILFKTAIILNFKSSEESKFFEILFPVMLLGWILLFHRHTRFAFISRWYWVIICRSHIISKNLECSFPWCLWHKINLLQRLVRKCCYQFV